MQSIITDDSSHTIDSETIQSPTDSSRGTSDVGAVNEALAKELGRQKYRIWFENSTRLELAGGYLKIAVPNLFIANWIENHFLDQIHKAVRSAECGDVKVTFTIDPELSGHQRRPEVASRKSAAANQSSALRHLSSTAEASQKTPPQTGHRKKKLKLSLDTFVVGSSNELAYNAAKVVVTEQQSPFNPLFVHGGYGVGKTHLLQGVCNAVTEKRPATNWMYLSAEDFVNQFVLALKTKKLETFRQRMRQTDLLAIDDIHFLAGKLSMQEEFLHTFNTINLAGKQVVLASDAHPKMISQLSEKLVNRFVSGMVVKIDPPDLETRCLICKQFIASIKTQSVPVPDGVIRYVAENLRASVRELEGALLKLIAYAALKNEKMTTAMAKAVLAEHLERCDPIVHVSDIESAVASYFGITPANIHSSKKDRTVALARHFSMFLTRKHTNMSSSEVGRVMGNKNHATVLLACRKIEDLIQRNSDIRWRSVEGNRISKARTVLSELEKSISR